ncbi:MAG: DnaD domain protein [Dehalococcoidia bacterium]
MTAAASMPFEGFVAGGVAVTLPAQLFTELLPVIDDPAELRVTLYAMYAIARERGALRAVRASALAAETPLLRALDSRDAAAAASMVRVALDAACTRGSLLACALDDGDTLVLVNNEAGRRALPRIQSGALAVPGATAKRATPSLDRPARPAQVYEQEIGTLSPAIADAIARASERWPEEWIIEALRLAAARNARSWRYAEAVLERWETEGKDDGATGSAVARPDARDHGPYDRFILRS